MSNLTTINQLKEQFKIQEFTKKTVRQINKDLNGLSFDDLSVIKCGSISLELLSSQLSLILKDLDTNSQLQQFIYIVDLPETNWNCFISFQNFNELAMQVIIREAQKVYLRQLFAAK